MEFQLGKGEWSQPQSAPSILPISLTYSSNYGRRTIQNWRMKLVLHGHNEQFHCQVAYPGFPRGTNLLFDQILMKNCITMKKIGRGVRGARTKFVYVEPQLLSCKDCSGMVHVQWQSSLTRKPCGMFVVSLVMPLSPSHLALKLSSYQPNITKSEIR